MKILFFTATRDDVASVVGAFEKSLRKTIKEDLPVRSKAIKQAIKAYNLSF